MKHPIRDPQSTIRNPELKHSQTIAMARGLLAEGRAPDVARMLEPLVAPVPEQVPGAFEAGQLVLRGLLARVRLLRYGDAVQASALLKPFETPAAREALAPDVRAEVALWLGWIHTWPAAATYDDARALHLLNEAERLFRQGLNPAGRCWALMGKARAYFALDEYPLMRRALDEVAALQKKVEDTQIALWTLDLLTLNAHFQGCYTQALTLAEAIKEQARHLDDPFALGRAFAYQAALYYDLGRPPASIIEAAAEAETLLQRAAVRPGYPLLAAFRAHVGALIRNGSWDQADHLVDTALEATSGQPTAEAHLLLQRVRLGLRRSRLADAEALLHTIEEQVHPLHHRLLAADVALAWSALRERQDAPNQAQTWAARAYAVARETGHGGRQLHALLALARLCQTQGDDDATHRYLGLTPALNDYFSVLPMATVRFSTLGLLALAEDNPEEARPYFAQALTASTLIGDVYQVAKLQLKLATLERTTRPVYTRALLEAALLTFDRLHADTDRDEAGALLDAWPADEEPVPEPDEASIGAALARAALSVDLIAETWLDAARRLLPDRGMGFYCCEEGHPWRCVREIGEAPAVPTTQEPCGPQLFDDEVLWLRLRGHPGPAFFFGVALPDRDDPAWRAARARMKPWMPVASLALEHALLRAERLGGDSNRVSLPGDAPAVPLQGFVYASPPMRALVGQIHRLRASHSPVLLTGERGVGKALLARVVHALSERKNSPFQTFACANVADEVSAGTLPEALAAAAGGTLYLADVDALPLGAQQKLLRFLQQGNVLPDGARQPVQADTRLIASTTQDLKACTRKGRFLEDLYYRLSVIPLPVPPLSQRREEIPLLVRHYLNELRPPGTPLPTLTNRAVEALLQYPWPGNVRQLRNEVERILLFAGSEPAPLIDTEDLAPAIVQASSAAGGLVPEELVAAAQEAILKPGHALDQVLAGTEKVLIEQVLAEHDGQVTASANALGLTRQGLYKKMKRLGIEAARFHPDGEARKSSTFDLN